MTMTDAYRAAIDRLATGPGSCAIDGCREEHVGVVVEPWDGVDRPPLPRFACPEHEVWLGHCFDVAAPGLFEAVLRDVSDPTWAWLPERMRPAAARAGFCVTDKDMRPRLRVGTCAGHLWATDGKTILVVGDEEELDASLAQLAANAMSASARELAGYRLEPSAIRNVLSAWAENDHVERMPARPSERGYSAEPWDRVGIAFGQAIVPARMCHMIEDVHGAVRWASGGRIDPVFALNDSGIVGVVMPIDTVEQERLARGDVCPAWHEPLDGFFNYRCELAPGHDGTIHEMSLPGGARHCWDERAYPRTDAGAGRAA